ncbi:3-hydroxyacyl-CoA dehydrogenase family protein [Demequina sp. NBRC 110053]|uniref:3-hydroxyacyl-CoA dehydrogenase family protein n=1 Tax=Demequina sp. NBRC 110053 TaxID=1570342 RepID=UPI0009FEE440|nr:3-hydroxyacyl-CoA dehydrogenase family protein [Demequina sp. NBRC 110053]
MITSIAVVGAGYMGGGIAQVFALAGRDVVIADVSEDAAQASLERVRREAQQFEADGLFPEGGADAVATRIAAAASIEEASASADLVIEAVFEKIDVKHEALTRISEAARADAIIGSNTSTISITALAEAVSGPERFLGVHFSNPAPFIPGVEVIPHEGTDLAHADAVEALLAQSGKMGARITDATGFVLNRLQYALFHEATQLIDEGVADAESIDAIVRTTFGFRLPFFGPFAIADMAGLDVYRFCYESLQSAFPERFATPVVLEDLVEDGALGVKSGRGFLNAAPESLPELVAYRNRAYVAMQKLIDELGPAPVRY